MKNKLYLRRLRTVLEKRRAALRQSLINDITDLQSGTGSEMGDAAEIALDDVFDLVSSQLAETESRELAQIEVALEKIRRGTYGKCDACGHGIPRARLEALPYASRCVSCKRDSELRGESRTASDKWSGGGNDEEGEPNNPFLDHVADIF